MKLLGCLASISFPLFAVLNHFQSALSVTGRFMASSAKKTVRRWAPMNFQGTKKLLQMVSEDLWVRNWKIVFRASNCTFARLLAWNFCFRPQISSLCTLIKCLKAVRKFSSRSPVTIVLSQWKIKFSLNMLQVKIKFRLKFLNLGWFSISFVSWP